MKKTILAGALSITCLTGGFDLQAQAKENAEVPSKSYIKQLAATTNVSQVQALSYQEIYKTLVLAKLVYEEDQMSVVSDKNSITLKISLEAIKESYEEEEAKEYEEIHKGLEEIFKDAIQMKFTQSGASFKTEIYVEGAWQEISAQDSNEFFTALNPTDLDLKPGGYFTDTIGHWAESYIQFLYQVDVINGTSNTTFNPNGQVTRGQLAAMIFRASGLDVNEDYEGPATYKDMQGFWGAKEVAILQEYGLIDIFDGTNFEPNKLVTREEMADVTAKYLIGMEIDAVEKSSKNNTFTDKGQMRKETVDSIGLLQQLGIVGGDGGKFNPKGNLTRAQFSKIMALSVLLVAEDEE
ncbi:S-layer homology domain-containing protein [Lysinibacillus sp. NPDC096418]|uniref:S-layer homology domain-containing protein n=1 Tax=Lysinibacillus sp. NPDC096418 TaxID=3364138 RepID=UPI00381B04F8